MDTKITWAEIEELAKQPKELSEALESRLAKLRSRGAGILQCIQYVKLNQGDSLSNAAEIVANSAAWADTKDEFWRQQQEVFEEFLADYCFNVASITEIYTM